MALNTTYKCNAPVQIALPYDQPNYTKLQGDGDPEEPSAVYYQGPSRREVADEDDSVVRITTRARTTYELDRYKKHAMLIISDNHLRRGINTKVRKKNYATMIYLKNAFERYNFDVTIVEIKEDNQIQGNDAGKQIDQFFQQDFSEVGATAVLMTTATRCFPIVTHSDGTVEVRDLLKHFIDHPSLQGKPKIFITEARDSAFHDAILLMERVNAEATASTGSCGLPDDVLLIQTKKVHNEYFRPLDLLCYMLNKMHDRSNLHDILPELYQKAKEIFPRHRAPIGYHSTLTKELVMDRLDVNSDTASVDLKEWLESLAESND